ncbi:MAG: hypothetical protein AB1656_05180 [Candidatus Omnitrophota bacterium]
MTEKKRISDGNGGEMYVSPEIAVLAVRLDGVITIAQETRKQVTDLMEKIDSHITHDEEKRSKIHERINRLEVDFARSDTKTQINSRFWERVIWIGLMAASGLFVWVLQNHAKG